MAVDPCTSTRSALLRLFLLVLVGFVLLGCTVGDERADLQQSNLNELIPEQSLQLKASEDVEITKDLARASIQRDAGKVDQEMVQARSLIADLNHVTVVDDYTPRANPEPSPALPPL